MITKRYVQVKLVEWGDDIKDHTEFVIVLDFLILLE